MEAIRLARRGKLLDDPSAPWLREAPHFFQKEARRSFGDSPSSKH